MMDSFTGTVDVNPTVVTKPHIVFGVQNGTAVWIIGQFDLPEPSKAFPDARSKALREIGEKRAAGIKNAQIVAVEIAAMAKVGG